MTKCVLCDQEATQTAAHIPVCDKHRRMYDEEGRQYLPYRPFYQRLVAAYYEQKRKDTD